MLLTCLQRKHGDSAVGATRPQPGRFSPSRLRGPNATGPTFFSSNSSQGKELGGDRARGTGFQLWTQRMPSTPITGHLSHGDGHPVQSIGRGERERDAQPMGRSP